MSAIRSVAVLGAGNGACAAAADLAARGFEVRLASRPSARLEQIAEHGGLDRTGACGEGFSRVDLVTDDVPKAVAGADLVMLAVPISAHPHYAGQLAEVLTDDQVLFLNPGHMGGGLFLARELERLAGRRSLRLCEVTTLTYGCRLRSPTTVNIMNVTTNLAFAAFPGRLTAELAELVRPLYPDIVPVGDVLETGFGDINAVEHPPQILCNAGWVEHTRGDYLFYYEGTTPAVGRVIDALDRERLAVAAAAGIRAKPFVEQFADLGYTTREAAATGSAYATLQDSAPNRWIKGPPSLDHRYVHEDVGWGLVPWSAMAAELGIATPVMDALITLGSTMNGIDYRREGLTLERLGLAGRDLTRLEGFLRDGS